MLHKTSATTRETLTRRFRARGLTEEPRGTRDVLAPGRSVPGGRLE
jgi:hypothetical protein